MEFVDTHCHIHFDDYGLDVRQVVEDAKTAGVKRIICVGTSLADSAKAVKFASVHQNVWASIGAHPHDGHNFLSDKKAIEIFQDLLSQPKVVAVGEIGLDYYRLRSSRLDQEKALRAQIEGSLAVGLPYIFHIRDAWGDFWRILDDYNVQRAVVHSFSAGVKSLDEVLARGFYVGLNGIMTFTHDEAQLEAARRVPLDKIILETDAPFLAPAKHRGDICQPKHVLEVAQFLAELRGEPLSELASVTTSNSVKLFELKS